MPGTRSGFWAADHKTVGTLYFVFAIMAGLVGVFLSLLIRMRLDGLEAASFYRLSAMLFSSIHGIVMIFFMMVPALFCGFGNWLVPMMCGAGDMAFPRLNRLGYWLFVLAFVLFGSALFYDYGSFAVRAALVAALHLAAMSALMSAVNFIVTIIILRAPAMSYRQMPPFLWAILIASFLMLMCMPVMTAAVTLWLGGQVWPSAAGAFDAMPQLQIMLWFFSHPEIYVLLLPAFGIISHIVATFTAGPLVGQKYVVAAMAVIGVAGFILWTHNLFVSPVAAGLPLYFCFVLPVIGIPAALIVACWLVTMRGGHTAWRTPMMWAAGFMFIFAAGAISGLHLAATHGFDTPPAAYVAHFHYVVSLGAVFAIFAGWYFWFPALSGLEIREKTGKLHFWMMFIAVNLIFLPQHFQAFAYAPHSFGFMVTSFAGWVKLPSIGAVLATGSLGVFLYGIAEALIRKKPAGNNPWGAGAVTWGWQEVPLHPVPGLAAERISNDRL